MSDVPGFLHDMEQKAEKFFHNMEAEVKAVVHPDAAPSSTAPAAEVGNAPAAAEASATAPATAEVPNAAPTPPAGDAMPVAGDLPNAVSAAAVPTVEAVSVSNADGANTTLPSAENSDAEPKTFEQRVEERFLKLEAAIMQLPASIHAVMSNGSMEAEDFGAAVVKHVLTHI